MTSSRHVSPRAARVWRRLTEWYGSRLAEQFGEDPPSDWCEIVDRADNETVKVGLARIRAQYAVHPPTLPQFEAAMKPSRPMALDGPSIAQRLAEHAMRTLGTRLTAGQIRGPWTYVGETYAVTNKKGETDPKGGVVITGVVIGADGDSPCYRIMVQDIDHADHAPVGTGSDTTNYQTTQPLGGRIAKLATSKVLEFAEDRC